MAAAFLAFISLRRIGKPKKAFWLLLLGLVGIALALFVLVRHSELAGNFLANSLAYFISVTLFPIMLRRDFDWWRSCNPEVKPASEWSAVGYGLVGLVGFLVVFLSVTIPVVLSEEVRDVNLAIYAESEVKRHQKFEIRVELENTAEHDQRLSRVGFADTYLDGFVIQKAEPRFRYMEPLPFLKTMEFVFEQGLPPKSKTVVTFDAVGVKEGTFTGAFSVCINSPTNCVEYQLSTKVTQRESQH